MTIDLSHLPSDAGPGDDGAAAPRRRRLWLLAAVVLVLLAVVGTVVVARRPVPVGDVGLVGAGAAPAFDLPRVGRPDQRVRLSDFAGRPLVLNFWASWCVPCRREMPALQAAADRLAGRVAFVGINHQDGATAAAEFEREVGVAYPSGADPAGEVARNYGVSGLPTTVLVDASGRIVARKLGEVTGDELSDLIERAFGLTVTEGAG